MATTNYQLDINKQPLINPSIILRQGDHDIDAIEVTVRDQGTQVDLTDASIAFMGMTNAGDKIIDSDNVTIVDAKTGIFKYVFPAKASATAGEYSVAYFAITFGNGQTSTMNFRLHVLAGVDVTASEAGDYMTQYNQMIESLNSMYDSAVATNNEKTASAVASVASSASSVLDSAVADVSIVSSVADQASAVASNAIVLASQATVTMSSAVTNVTSTASSAVADINSASNTFIKTSRTLPEEARDFKYLAQHMQTYQGVWWNGTEEIINGPITGWTWSVIEVVAGNAETTGEIRTMRQGQGGVYSANVNNGTLGPWLPMTPSSRAATFSDLAVVAKSMKNYAGTWYATGTQDIQNGPRKMDFNSIITVINSWDDAGLIIVSSQGYNTWVGGVTSGAISHWTLIADDAEVVHKSGDTMTGDLLLGADATVGKTGTRVTAGGGLALANASSPWVDFHPLNSADYVSHLVSDVDGLQASNKGYSGQIVTPVVADANHIVNIDTMEGGNPVLKSRINWIVIIHFAQAGSASGTLPPDFTGFGTLIHYGISGANATQLYFDTNDESFGIRYMASGEWKSWHSFVDNKVAEKEVSPKAGGVKIKLRRTGTTVHASFFGTPSNTLGFDVTLAEYAASDLAGFIPLESTNNYGSGDIKGNALSVRLQNADTDTLTLKQRSSQSGDPEYVAAGAMWETADAWPS